MKKVIFGFLILTGVMAAVVLYERIVVQGMFGPSSMLAVVTLAAFFLSLVITLLLYETRFREITGKIWLMGVSVAVTYLVVDLVAGFFLIASLSPELVPDDYRHHKLVPNSHAKFDQRDFSYIQRVNNVGLRGRDIELKEKGDEYWIVMLGDSFTMGKGVEDHETFSVLLEADLNSERGTCAAGSVQVLNAGVDSYAPILSFLQLTRDLKDVNPDVVVLNLDMSDLMQEAAYRRLAVYKADGELIGVPGAARDELVNEKIRAWIEQHLYITRLLLFYTNKLLDHKDLTVRSLVTQANLEIAKHTLEGGTALREKEWVDMFDSVKKIKAYCDDRAIQFFLTIYPWGHQVGEREWNPGRYNFIPKNAVVSDEGVDRIRAFSAEQDIQLIDLFPAFRGYSGERPLYFDYDPHWTPAGHELVAKAVLGYLEDRVRADECH